MKPVDDSLEIGKIYISVTGGPYPITAWAKLAEGRILSEIGIDEDDAIRRLKQNHPETINFMKSV